MAALVDPAPSKKRIALSACAGPGKSAALSMGGWWFLSTLGDTGEHPKGLAIATTKENLDDNLWPEFAKWRLRSLYLQECYDWSASAVYCKSYPDTWFISTRSWNRSASPEEQGKTLSGLHSQYVLALIDESGDVPPSVLRSAEQALSRCVWGKIVQAGNPISRDGMLYKAVVELAHQWHVIRITGDPDDPKRSPRIDIEWAREQIKNYGRDNPWVKAYILGEFPDVGFNQLLGYEEVRRAMGRNYALGDIVHAQKRLGVDVARFGDDASCLFPRQGLVAFRPKLLRGARTTEVAGAVIGARNRWGQELEFVDATGGYGAGVCDVLVSSGYEPVEVEFGGRPIDPKFYNKRSEILWLCAEWVKEKGQLPNEPQLIRELTAPTYTFRNGRIWIEEKEQIKKRLGFSPDMFDALATTFATPDMPAFGAAEQIDRAARQGEEEYEPLSPRNMELTRL